MGSRLDTVAKPVFQSSEVSSLADTIRDKLLYQVGTEPDQARPEDWLHATVFALRDHIVDRWVESEHKSQGRKRVYYLSIEYLIGRLLFSALSNMEFLQPARAALETLGVGDRRTAKFVDDPGGGVSGLH